MSYARGSNKDGHCYIGYSNQACEVQRSRVFAHLIFFTFFFFAVFGYKLLRSVTCMAAGAFVCVHAELEGFSHTHDTEERTSASIFGSTLSGQFGRGSDNLTATGRRLIVTLCDSYTCSALPVVCKCAIEEEDTSSY